MSAFMVSDKTINRVLTYLNRYMGKDNPLVEEFSEENYDLVSEDGLRKLGHDMFFLNQAGVNSRYGANQAKEFRDLNYQPDLYTVNSGVQVLKSLRCFLYQCTEGDVPDHPLFVLLQKLSMDMAFNIVMTLPEYDAAEWD